MKSPLRRVLGRISAPAGTDLLQRDSGPVSETEIPYELLECGHIQLPKSDIYGETNAVRRRCRFCGSGAKTLPQYERLAKELGATEKPG